MQERISCFFKMIAAQPSQESEINRAIEEVKKTNKEVLSRGLSRQLPSYGEPEITSRIGGLEKILLDSGEENVEDKTENDSFFKEMYKKEEYLLDENSYESTHRQVHKPEDLFIKGGLPYVSEFKIVHYIKYRTMAQNLRNITLARGLMSFLEYSGALNVVRKVK